MSFCNDENILIDAKQLPLWMTTT